MRNNVQFRSTQLNILNRLIALNDEIPGAFYIQNRVKTRIKIIIKIRRQYKYLRRQLTSLQQSRQQPNDIAARVLTHSSISSNRNRLTFDGIFLNPRSFYVSGVVLALQTQPHDARDDSHATYSASTFRICTIHLIRIIPAYNFTANFPSAF